MTDLLPKIFAPRLKFEGADESEKFIRFFCDLYRIEIFKDGLDLILTKLQEQDLSFEVRIIKGWDTNLGCYLTEQNKVFNSILGKFSRQIKKTIIIKNFKHNVMAHEMAHALEFESGVDLGQEFNQCLSVDLQVPNIFALIKEKHEAAQNNKDFAAKHAALDLRKSGFIALDAQIKRLMFDDLKAYEPNQFLSELFARYFELLAITRDVHGSGDFTSLQVMDFFINTTNFITKIFNPAIKSKIDPTISKATQQVAERAQIDGPQKKFQDNVNSFYKKTDNTNQKSFAKNVRSNSAYQAGWQQYQALEDKKNK